MAHAETLPSLVLERYRLDRRLGSGGFGTVWLAHDERLGRPVAVKRIPTDGPEQAERARREATAAARLAHPGIVALYEAGADDDACYLVSELVRGETLGALEEAGALSDRDVVEIGVALCDGLAHAHARGVVHRDVKPGNVLVPDAPESGAGVAKLTDFGIARILGDDALTRTGDVLGTLAYMAPEQAEGRRVTAAADLYALALVVYEALTGTNPVRGATPAETARRLGTALPPLARARRDLPRALCAAIDAALDAAPERRGSLADLRAALHAARGAVADEPGTVVAPGIAGATQRWLTARPRRPRPETLADELGWADDAEREDDDGLLHADPYDRRAAGPFARLAAGVGAGALVAAAVAAFAAAAPVTPLAAGAATALAVSLVPRLAWISAALCVAAWLAGTGATGAAVLLLAGTLVVPPLLRRAPTAWSVPGAAPALGLVGLAVAFPVLAGQASTLVRRAALGALGAAWITLSEPLAGRTLLTGAPAPPGAAGSATIAWRDVLVPAVGGGHLAALALTWAAAAAVLPVAVRGHRASRDALAAVAWAALLAAGTAAALDPVRPHGLLGGAAVAAVAAVAARAARVAP